MSDGDKDRLMVSSSVDGRNFVEAGGKTTGNISSQNAVDSSSVQTLEESEFSRVCRCRLGEGIELLDDYVGVTNNLALGVQLLRSSEIILLSVDEVASFEVGHSHRDGEGCVLLQNVAVLGDLELSRWHVVR